MHNNTPTFNISDLEFPTYEIEGGVYVPPGTLSNPHWILPDAVVSSTATRYELAKLRGLDPMCGVGTIPRIIGEMNGSCDAMDIDPQQVATASKVVPGTTHLVQGDCLELKADKPYNYIYTSIPFMWFEHYPEGLDEKLADAFHRLIVPDGILIVDSDDYTQRDGRKWPLAISVVRYFERHGFHLDEGQRYALRSKQQAGDTTFVELKFSRV